MKTLLIALLLVIPISLFAQNKTDEESQLHDRDTAPDIVGVDTLGSETQLNNLSTPYTLLYFYDFNCGHCNTILPILINLYDKYKSSGLQVFAVPMINDRETWINYLRQNKISWLDVLVQESRLTRIRQEYKLYSTPTIYLLDKDKKVIGSRMTVGDEVDKALKKSLR